MIPIAYMFEQDEPQPPQEDGSLTDRIYSRAMDRTVTPEESEEESVEAQAQDKVEQEKMGAKVTARSAEIADRDVELKQLKAATAALTKKATEDTATMEKGMIPDGVQQDKAEKDAAEVAAAKQQQAAENAPPEGDSKGQEVAESLNDYI